VTDDNAPPEPRRRNFSQATQTSREAARLVRGINDKLGDWQAESIRLATAADRMRQSGRQEPAIVAAIETLMTAVEGQLQAFAAELLQAPADVAAHSRVADTRQALQMVVDRLRAALPK
jgi:hypothetical protein